VITKFDVTQWFNLKESDPMALTLVYPQDVPITLELEFEETEERESWQESRYDPYLIQTVGHKEKAKMKFYLWDTHSASCRKYRMFSNYHYEVIQDVESYSECLNSATVFSDEDSRSFHVFLKDERFLKFEGFTSSEELEYLYMGKSRWDFRNLQATYAETIKDDPQNRNFVVYRPGLDM
jgi:hypothetical protein